MENNSKMVSANEINKYIYCSYQWYYERYYGKKFIREAYKKRNDKSKSSINKAKTTTHSNFKKGNDFHNNFLIENKIRLIFKVAFVAIFIIVMLIIFYFTK